MLQKFRDRLLLLASSDSAVRQAGAIPSTIVQGQVVFLLITSRRSGRWIFPKGELVEGMTPWALAAHEAFEEAGIFLAYAPAGDIVDLGGKTAERYQAHRRALDQGRTGLGEVARAEGLRLATDRLVYFSHWITPVGAPRRYDTRFFLAIAPSNQDAEHDNREAIAHAWMSPAEALDRCQRKEIKLRTPTLKTLERFAGFSRVEALAAELRAKTEMPALLPRVSRDGRNLLPGDPGYEEAGEAALGPQGVEAVVPAGEQLPGVGLMPDVPEDLVGRGVEDIEQRDREFHHPEGRPDVAPGTVRRILGLRAAAGDCDCS